MVFANNFWTTYDRRMKMAPISLSHNSKSNDMQHNLLWPDLTSDIRSNFDLGFLRSTWSSFDLSRQEEHIGSKINALDPTGQKLLEKKKHLC